MAKFQIDWTEEVWKRVTVEAESEEDVLTRFIEGEFEDVEPYGGDTQDSVDIQKVGE
jgi:hypothetical protein